VGAMGSSPRNLDLCVASAPRPEARTWIRALAAHGPGHEAFEISLIPHLHALFSSTRPENIASPAPEAPKLITGDAVFSAQPWARVALLHAVTSSGCLFPKLWHALSAITFLTNSHHKSHLCSYPRPEGSYQCSPPAPSYSLCTAVGTN
jgi:hypothetical protein